MVELNGICHNRTIISGIVGCVLKYDLHSHTNLSDGSLSPIELVMRASVKQVDVLAITDHDSVAGIDLAHREIIDKGYKVHLVPGVEISTKWNGFDIHVVGLCIDRTDTQLLELLTEQRLKRELRAKKIGEKLEKKGLTGVYDLARTMASGDSISRSHFAKAMLELGYINNFDQAFKKYLGKGKSAFVSPDWCDLSQACLAIKNAGGIAVLAHPVRYDLSNKWLRKLIFEFKSAGGEALEVGLVQMNPDQKKFIASLATEHELYSSQGSDFHHVGRWTELGRNLSITEQCKPVWEHPKWNELAISQ